MKIVSGRTGSPHVTSQQFRQMLEGIIGQGSYIITSGENLKPELSSNNLMKIRSGMMAHHGCISCVDIGTYDEVTLTNGSQGMKRIDLIVNRYTRNAETEVENCSWKVIQGTPVASNPAVPAYTSGNLQNGDLVDDCPAFEVHYDGINVTEVKSLLSVADGLSELSSNLSKANTVLENRKPIFIATRFLRVLISLIYFSFPFFQWKYYICSHIHQNISDKRHLSYDVHSLNIRVYQIRMSLSQSLQQLYSSNVQLFSPDLSVNH